METTLQDVTQGQAFRIEDVDDEEVRAQLLRMGFLDGEVECLTHLNRGPVVIARRGTELALGDSVTSDVEITITDLANE